MIPLVKLIGCVQLRERFIGKIQLPIAFRCDLVGFGFWLTGSDLTENSRSMYDCYEILPLIPNCYNSFRIQDTFLHRRFVCSPGNTWMNSLHWTPSNIIKCNILNGIDCKTLGEWRMTTEPALERLTVGLMFIAQLFFSFSPLNSICFSFWI